MSSAEELLGLTPPTETVEIRGLKFNVRGLTSREADEYQQSLLEMGPDGKRRVKTHQENFRANLVARTLVDDNGDLLFTGKDIAKLGEVDANVIETLWKKARSLSGMADDDEEEANAEAFDSAQDDGSVTA